MTLKLNPNLMRSKRSLAKVYPRPVVSGQARQQGSVLRYSQRSKPVHVGGLRRGGFHPNAHRVLPTAKEPLNPLPFVIDDTLERSRRDGVLWHVPELFRLKGELSNRQSGDRSLSTVESLFSEAIELARKQAALFWELRAAVSLARLKIQQFRQAEARNVLEPICGAFAAETDFSDLRIARELLNSVSPRLVG